MNKIVVLGTRAYGRGFRDSIRKENVARGFDLRIACGQSSAAALSRQLGVPIVDDKELPAAFGLLQRHCGATALESAIVP